MLAQLGCRSLEEAIGHVECLRQRRTGDAAVDLASICSPLLGPQRGRSPRFTEPGDLHVEVTGWGPLLLAQGRDAVRDTASSSPAI